MFKRIFDIIFSGIGLILFSPVILVIAIIIKRTSPGPVFYRGERTGLYGKPFRIFKFRSMVVDAEKTGVLSTSQEDARVTPIGRFVRKTKLDEIPQLINVFIGDMSLVGPRPEVQRFTDMYTEEEKILLTIRPGITDYASVWNSDEATLLAGSADPDGDYLRNIRPEKIRLQLKYFKERSLITDLKILFLTVKKLVFRS